MAALWKSFSVLSVVCLLLCFLSCGGDEADGLLDAIEVTGEQLVDTVKHVEFVLVLFCEKVNDQCRYAIEELEEIEGTSFRGLGLAYTTSPEMSAKFGITSYPTLLFFRQETPILDTATVIEYEDVMVWMEQHRDIVTKTLTDDNFEHDTQAASGATTGNWFVMFYKPECSHFIAAWEEIAARSKFERPVAAVDLSTNPGLAARFKSTLESKCLTFVLFGLGKMYEYTGPHSIEPMVQFAKEGYRSTDWLPVPKELSGFDVLVDKTRQAFSGFLSSPVMKWMALGGGVAVFFAAVGLIIGLSRRKKTAKFD